MKKEYIILPALHLVGINCRANNKLAFAADTSKNPIAATVQRYFHEGLFEKINDRLKPGTTYCAYTEYESDHHGDYTYFVGEVVKSFNNVPEGFTTLIIPEQKYAKFTNEPGAMPMVCINMWQKIWDMSAKDLGGERAYLTDFEVYDERAMDHQNVVLDIYLGIKK
jgi:predicted transcriptional regulator YdeE